MQAMISPETFIIEPRNDEKGEQNSNNTFIGINYCDDHCSILALSVFLQSGDFQSRNFGNCHARAPNTGNLHLESVRREKLDLSCFTFQYSLFFPIC